MRPPYISKDFDDNSVWDKALLIAYEEIREYEEIKSGGCPLLGGSK